MKTLESGLALNSPAFFTDSPMSKNDLAKTLGVGRSTIGNWARKAYFYIPDFKNAYPVLNGEIIKQAPLSPYQCWCLTQVGKTVKMMGNVNLAIQYINENPKEFSKNQFKVAVSKIN